MDRYGRQLGCKLYAYLLKSRYAYLLMETPRGNVSRVMQRLGTAYTGYFNRRHKRRGPLFEGRYRSCLIDKETGLAEVTRYIHRDQFRSSPKIKNKRDYPWSSYQIYLGRKASSLVDTRTVLSQFGRHSAERKRRYREFVEKANGRAGGHLGRIGFQQIVGPADFIARVSLRARQPSEVGKEPSLRMTQRIIEAVLLSLGSAKAVDDGRARRKREALIRHVTMYLIRLHTPLPLRSIGGLLGVKAPAVALAIGKVERLLKRGEFSKEIRELIKADRFVAPERVM